MDSYNNCCLGYSSLLQGECVPTLTYSNVIEERFILRLKWTRGEFLSVIHWYKVLCFSQQDISSLIGPSSVVSTKHIIIPM